MFAVRVAGARWNLDHELAAVAGAVAVSKAVLVADVRRVPWAPNAHKRKLGVPVTADPRAALADWVFGAHAVRALVASAPGEVRRVVLAESRRSRHVDEVAAFARDAGVRVERAPGAALRRRAQARGVAGHVAIAAERNAYVAFDEADLETRWSTFANPLLVVLDGVQDPRNLGACLRTAEAGGAVAVLLPKRGSAPLSSVVAKAASGALEHLFIVSVGNLARRLGWLRERGVWLVGGVDAGGDVHTAIDYRGPVAILVGGEHRGLRRLTRDRCDHLVSIPMAGAVSSLNVSVALGVLLFEAGRQRAVAARAAR